MYLIVAISHMASNDISTQMTGAALLISSEWYNLN
jgi:hypothetical protein